MAYTALLLLLQHMLLRGASACSNPVSSFVAPSSPSTYTYQIGTGDYTFDIPAWT